MAGKEIKVSIDKITKRDPLNPSHTVDAWERVPESPAERAARREFAEDLAMNIAYHIESMYPEAVKAAPKSFLKSVRGFIQNKVNAELERIVARAIEESRQWISVEEKLPELQHSVLVWHEPTRRRFVAQRLRDTWYEANGPTTGVTHWQPIAAEPKEGGSNG